MNNIRLQYLIDKKVVVDNTPTDWGEIIGSIVVVIGLLVLTILYFSIL
jgi:hypothetical protein